MNKYKVQYILLETYSKFSKYNDFPLPRAAANVKLNRNIFFSTGGVES